MHLWYSTAALKQYHARFDIKYETLEFVVLKKIGDLDRCVVQEDVFALFSNYST